MMKLNGVTTAAAIAAVDDDEAELSCRFIIHRRAGELASFSLACHFKLVPPPPPPLLARVSQRHFSPRSSRRSNRPLGEWATSRRQVSLLP